MGLLGSLGEVAYSIMVDDKTGTGSKSAEKNLMGVGAAFTGVGAGAVVMSSDVTEAFRQFDESMVKVKALGVLTEEEFDRAKRAAIDMSKQYPISATEVSDAMYGMISVGYDFDTMMRVLPEAAQLAVGGNMDLAEAVDTVINVFGAYGDNIYSAADVTNILAKAVGVGKWELGDFTDEIMKNVGSASTLGIEFDELAAANVLLQNSFTSSEVAGTSLNTMLTRLVDPTVVKKLETMGVKVKDNEGNFVGLKSVLDQLEVALQGTGGNVEKMSILQEIFGTYGVKAAMALLDEKESLGELTGEMNDAEFKQDAYNTVAESATSKQELLNNQYLAAKVALGESMNPAVETAAGLMGGLADIISELPEPLKGIAGSALFVAQGFALLGPALMGLAGLKMLGLGAIFTSISTALSGLVGSLSGIGTLIVGGITSSIGIAFLTIAGSVLVGLGIVKGLFITGAMDWMAGVVDGVRDSDIGNAILDGLSIAFAPLMSIGTLINNLVLGNWDAGRILSDMAYPFEAAFEKITTVIGGIPGALSGAFSSISEAFSALGGRVQEAFSALFTGISEFIVGLAQGFISAGYNIIMYIVQGMQSAAGAVGDAIGGIFNIIGQFIPHSPAETGPLSQLPNFGAYFVDPLLATVPAVEAASVQVAEAVAMPAAQPASMSGGTNIGSQDNSSTIDIGSINASSDYPIDKIMADIAAMQAQKRTQRGYTT
ncbi:phage tail tape measure protein [Methanospirillum sp. J.3.6.1-F.2.7.3]|uniref:Phage tail tape measure protein n=3 Tax=Methanospirillum purgamenti TaxID=2834276 RepID=A0A8E7B1B0_9EURY|nr:phage tail tape measure protein [Methanospirillum sp. J.3.6.1-F.2.7.3]